MKIPTKYALTAMLAILIFVQSFAQIKEKEVDELMNRALKEFQVAGAAIGIVKDGKVFLTKGYGVQSTETKQPVTAHTNFEIASNSKAFTAAALAILKDQGKINWDDAVVKYIPEFKAYDEYVTQHFTIADLLSHRSGMGLGAGDLMWFPDGSDFTMDELLQRFQYQKQTSEFRTHFDYNNLLFIVAGEVVKRVSGMSWEEFVLQNITQPLGMDNTYTALAQIKNQSTLSAPHAQDAKGIPHAINNYPHILNGAAAAMISNVDDLSLWMIAQLNEGKYGPNLEKQLFSEESQTEMWTIRTPMTTYKKGAYNTHFKGYGLGWFLSDAQGKLVVEHTGGMPGMLSKTLMIPDLEMGVVILTNTSDGGAGLFQAVSKTIMEKYLGVTGQDWIKIYAQNMAKSREEADQVISAAWKKVNDNQSTQPSTAGIIGTFKDPWFGEIVVQQKNGKLWMTCLRSPRLNGEMFFYQANTYLVKWAYTAMECDAFVTFSLDENAKAQSMKLKPISPNTDFSFDFEDLAPVRVK